MTRIKELREQKGLRQIDVAKATGIDQRSLSNYETGKTNPDAYSIVKLAKFFNVTCDYLLGVTAVNFSGAESVIGELNDIRNRIESIERYLNSFSDWEV